MQKSLCGQCLLHHYENKSVVVQSFAFHLQPVTFSLPIRMAEWDFLRHSEAYFVNKISRQLKRLKKSTIHSSRSSFVSACWQRNWCLVASRTAEQSVVFIVSHVIVFIQCLQKLNIMKSKRKILEKPSSSNICWFVYGFYFFSNCQYHAYFKFIHAFHLQEGDTVSQFLAICETCKTSRLRCLSDM